jgi:hypothetical protein
VLTGGWLPRNIDVSDIFGDDWNYLSISEQQAHLYLENIAIILLGPVEASVVNMRGTVSLFRKLHTFLSLKFGSSIRIQVEQFRFPAFMYDSSDLTGLARLPIWVNTNPGNPEMKC